MTLYHLLDHAELDDPLMIVAFDAWVDAGSAATTAATLLAEGAVPVAGIEADGLYDYRARRPTLHIDDGRLSSLDWPRLQVMRRRFPRRDVLLLSGPEPDYRWQELARELVMLAQDLEVSEWMTLGSIPAAVPHTRPVSILGIASADGLLKGGIEAGPIGSMQVPAAAVSVIDMAVAEAGIPTYGYFAQVPHYISGDYPAAAVALIRAAERHVGESITTAVLELQARSMAAKLDLAAAADDATQSYVDRLEAMSDEARLPSGDELIGEIERFLRERGAGDD
ncbi:MAG TPA: PAC2 family protein [Anaerolineae bacterium]|nr:PAC2 family protein [Anaerolineae bacterium]